MKTFGRTTMKDIIAKVCVTGEGGTGKTSLLHRYVSGSFLKNIKMTIGTGLMTCNKNGDDYLLTYQLWDFAGEKRFRFFLPNYLKGSKAVFLCYDTTRYVTLQNLNDWYRIVAENVNFDHTHIYLIGTKTDLAHKRAILPNVIQDWIKGKKIDRVFECSALSGENISQIFDTLTSDILEHAKKKFF